MPIVSAENQASRRGTRWWLIPLLVLAGVLLLLPLVRCLSPVALHSGDRWLFIEGAWLSPRRAASVPPGFQAKDRVQMVRVFSEHGDSFPVQWITTGGYHQRCVLVGPCYYSVEWFQGYLIR